MFAVTVGGAMLVASGSSRIRKHFLTRRLFFKTTALFAAAQLPFHASATSGGRYIGKIVTEWLPDGRNMVIVHAFEYIDPEGRKWPVPAGTKVDGASIPQPFWSVIGGPFEGLYRNASVVHDFYCIVRTRKAADVHKVFRDAMLTSGVGESRAWLMWKAVDQFGPRWKDPNIDPACEIVDENYDFNKCARNAVRPPLIQPELQRADLERFLSEFKGDIDPADAAKLKSAIKAMR